MTVKPITNSNSGTLLALISVCNKFLAPKFLFLLTSSFWQILPHWPSMASTGVGINMGFGRVGSDIGNLNKYLEKFESPELTIWGH